ncbi:hypothetical protein MKX08_001492 [Trichoderma sp. CBMAI-0020]|nr:hypothetical protein MKX08_001492 [Trichoderma sp. CBMAI-0020]
MGWLVPASFLSTGCNATQEKKERRGRDNNGATSGSITLFLTAAQIRGMQIHPRPHGRSVGDEPMAAPVMAADRPGRSRVFGSGRY